MELDETTVPAGYLSTTLNNPMDIVLGENEEYTGADFGYRSLDRQALPSAIPNPFIAGEHPNPEVKIPFDLDESGSVKISIFSASGHRVREDETESLSVGVQMYAWNLNDDEGRPVPSGIYIYLVTSGDRLMRREKVAVVR